MPRSFILVPLVALVSAWLGNLSTLPIVEGGAALLLGAGATAAISWSVARRLDVVGARVRRFAQGGAAEPAIRGSRAWRRVGLELFEAGEVLRRRYQELADEQARVERLLDSLSTAVLLFDADGLAYTNPAASDMFRTEPGRVRSPMQVLRHEGLAGAVAEVRETGRSVDVEVELAERHLTAHAAATGDGVVAIAVTDVTDARRLEAIRRDFVTNASHELKTPVAGMQALADSLTLAIDRDPDRARTMIERLRGEASRLATLVRELLDLARLEEDAAAQAGRQRVDFADVVRAQADRLAALAAERDIVVELTVSEPAPVVAFPGDLRLIAGNLIENAVRYNRAGGRVDVRLRRSAADVVLEVQDTGIGIAEADRDRIFERFYRVDKARSRAVGGTGLGLSIVRHAADRHGGEVTVSSVLGEGSSFRVVLPVEGARSGR